MIVTVWRIGSDTPYYTAEDRTGDGARATGGRWNSKGVAMVYTTSSVALACLETLVHIKASDLPMNRYLVRITIPAALISKATVFDPALHVGWDSQPCGMVSLNFGDQWLKSMASAVLIVPSSIIPEEINYLINPLHPDAAKVTFTKTRKFVYDNRLKKA